MSQQLTIVDSLRAEHLNNIAIEAAYAQQQFSRLEKQILQAKILLDNLEQEYDQHIEAHSACFKAIEGQSAAIRTYYQLISA